MKLWLCYFLILFISAGCSVQKRVYNDGISVEWRFKKNSNIGEIKDLIHNKEKSQELVGYKIDKLNRQKTTNIKLNKEPNPFSYSPQIVSVLEQTIISSRKSVVPVIQFDPKLIYEKKIKNRSSVKQSKKHENSMWLKVLKAVGLFVLFLVTAILVIPLIAALFSDEAALFFLGIALVGLLIWGLVC